MNALMFVGSYDGNVQMKLAPALIPQQSRKSVLAGVMADQALVGEPVNTTLAVGQREESPSAASTASRSSAASTGDMARNILLRSDDGDSSGQNDHSAPLLSRVSRDADETTTGLELLTTPQVQGRAVVRRRPSGAT